MDVQPRLLVMTPSGVGPAVGVMSEAGRVTVIVKLTFEHDRLVPGALAMHDFVPPKTQPEVWRDGAVIATPRRLRLGEALDVGAHGVWTLPRVEPQVTLCDDELDAALPVPMACDSLCLEERRLALVWRGQVDAGALHERDRVVVTLGSELGEPARAQLSFAETPAGSDHDADVLLLERLALERLALAGRSVEPGIPLELYAAVSAELAEQREPRSEVLARRGFDESSWTLEERAWLERMSDAAMDGDASLAAAFGDHFVAAQDALGSREEQDAMIHEYVAVSVELERNDDPAAVLARWSLSLAQWLRLDRHWSRRAAEDDKVKQELERMFAGERARAEDVE